jgi:hypothetical protein
MRHCLNICGCVPGRVQVGDSIPADSLAAQVLQLHLEHLLPMLRFEPKEQAGLLGARKQLLQDVRSTLQASMKRRLTGLLEGLILDVQRRQKAFAAPAAAGIGGNAAAEAAEEAQRSGEPALSSRSNGIKASAVKLFAELPVAATPKQLFLQLVELTFPDHAWQQPQHPWQGGSGGCAG